MADLRRRALPSSLRFEALVLLYVAVLSGYVMITRGGAAGTAGGLAILPWAQLVYVALTFVFILASGWHRDAHHRIVLGLRIPVPTPATLVSGIGSAMMVSAIPMSYGQDSVSIPLILVLMRGGVLAIAPLVDLVYHRRIHWWSGVALLLVAAALLWVLHGREGGALPPLVVATVALYNLGFLLRLAMMSRIAKRGDDAQNRQYFVEERLVALPLSLVGLLVLVVAGSDADTLAQALHVDWTPQLIAAAAGMGLLMTAVSVLATLILLDAQENSFCVPVERAGSLLAGFIAAWMLHWTWSGPAPTATEIEGAGLLLAAILLLAAVRLRR